MSGRCEKLDGPLSGRTALRFYVSLDSRRPGLGMDYWDRLLRDPEFGRLVVGDARCLLDELEREIAEAEGRARDGKA